MLIQDSRGRRDGEAHRNLRSALAICMNEPGFAGVTKNPPISTGVKHNLTSHTRYLLPVGSCHPVPSVCFVPGARVLLCLGYCFVVLEGKANPMVVLGPSAQMGRVSHLLAVRWPKQACSQSWLWLHGKVNSPPRKRAEGST